QRVLHIGSPARFIEVGGESIKLLGEARVGRVEGFLIPAGERLHVGEIVFSRGRLIGGIQLAQLRLGRAINVEQASRLLGAEQALVEHPALQAGIGRLPVGSARLGRVYLRRQPDLLLQRTLGFLLQVPARASAL